MRHFNKSSLLPVLRIASGTNLLHIEQFAFNCWEELPTREGRGGGGGGGGGHSRRCRVQSCDRGQDAVKWSRHSSGV